MKSFLDLFKDQNWKEFINFHTKITKFSKDEYIFKEGNHVLGLYIINTGKVKIIRNIDQESEKLVRLASDTQIVGHRGFGADWRYPTSAQCYTDTELYFIPISIIKTTMRINAEFSYNLMMFFAEELRHAERLMDIKSVKARIAYCLIYNSKVFGFNKDSGSLNFTIPRKDIANFALTTYESVVRTLSDFNNEGFIKIENKSILIKDFKALEDLTSRS